MRCQYSGKLCLRDTLVPPIKQLIGGLLSLLGLILLDRINDCQEIGLVALMFFFELLFSYVSSSISLYVSFADLFSIILFPYLLITRDTQDEGEAGFRFY